MTDNQPANPVSSPHNSRLLKDRRRWYDCFPDGTLEFVSTMRIVYTLLLFVIPIGGTSFRTAGFAGIAVLLLADMILSMYWLTQLAADRRLLTAETNENKGAASRMIYIIACVAVCHAILFGIAMTFRPPGFVLTHLKPAMMGTARIALIALWIPPAVLSFILAGRLMNVKNPILKALLLVPVASWFSIRRISANIAEEYHRRTPHLNADEEEYSRAGILGAEVLQVLSLLALLGTAAKPGLWSHMNIATATASILFGLAAIADMAAIENAHRSYVQFFHKSQNKPA